jgi:hypothetical protein
VLEATYLGSGGWILRFGDRTVLTAPFFSHRSLLRTGSLAMQSDTVAVDAEMSRYDVTDATAIVVGHGHYDHLLDVPRVATVHAPRATVVGSRTVANLLGSWAGLSDRIEVVNGLEADQNELGQWSRLDPRVRVLALRGSHAPHFDGFTLYRGTVDDARDHPPRSAREWLDGNTFAYLIDFLDERAEVAFRVYYQDAGMAPPFGYAPERLVDARPVDVAIIAPSTLDHVEGHPEGLVQNLRARFVLMGHWEDFFRPFGAPARAVPLNNFSDIRDRLERALPGRSWWPEVGAVFRFPGVLSEDGSVAGGPRTGTEPVDLARLLTR